jgi:tRNA threonylcarbamoyladenosine biosynthesis protein TsaB
LGNLLALELSTPEGILILESNGKLFQRRLEAGSRVSQLFFESRELLREANIEPQELTLIGVGRGPGSFTGIRVAVMAAKALAMVLRLPLVAPDSLEILAEACRGIAESAMIAIDARRGEIYYGVYDLTQSPPLVLEEPQVATPQDASALALKLGNRLQGRLALAGSGITAYPGAWPHGLIVIESEVPRGEGLAGICRKYHELGRLEDATNLLPLYLRKPDIKEPLACGGSAPCA